MANELIVITGAAHGIGRALCECYLAEGERVLAIDRNQVALQAFESEVNDEKLMTFTMDVTQKSEHRRLIEFIRAQQFRPIVWINNAGIALIEKFMQLELETIDQILDVNIKGVIYGTRSAFELMQNPERGKVINMASINGMVPAPYMSAYSASKHAVVGFTRCVQEELRIAHSALQLILVVPGFVNAGVFHAGKEKITRPWLNKIAAPLTSCAKEIVAGIQAGDLEIYPTWNGRMMKHLYRYFPYATKRASQYLVAKNWREVLGLDPIKR